MGRGYADDDDGQIGIEWPEPDSDYETSYGKQPPYVRGSDTSKVAISGKAATKRARDVLCVVYQSARGMSAGEVEHRTAWRQSGVSARFAELEKLETPLLYKTEDRRENPMSGKMVTVYRCTAEGERVAARILEQV